MFLSKPSVHAHVVVGKFGTSRKLL